MSKSKIFIFLLLSLNLYGCENIKKGLGIEKSSPDEFLVERRKDIVLPPDYNLIEPQTKNSEQKEIDLKSILNKEIGSTKQENQNLNKDNQNKSSEKEILNKLD